MILTEEQRIKALKGNPCIYQDICAVFPVTLGKIADIGLENFWKYLNCVLMKKPTTVPSDMKELLDQLTEFQFFCLVNMMDAKTLEITKDAFRFFTHEEIIILMGDKQEIVIGPIEEKHTLNEQNFSDFQSLIAVLHKVEEEDESIAFLPTDSPQMIKHKQMLMERKKILARKKARENVDSKIDLSDLIASLCTGHLAYGLHNVWDLTYFAFHDQLKRMNWKEEYNTYMRLAASGAKIKKEQLKHWIRSMQE